MQEEGGVMTLEELLNPDFCSCACELSAQLRNALAAWVDPTGTCKPLLENTCGAVQLLRERIEALEKPLPILKVGQQWKSKPSISIRPPEDNCGCRGDFVVVEQTTGKEDWWFECTKCGRNKKFREADAYRFFEYIGGGEGG
jgi:hypothetical protein